MRKQTFKRQLSDIIRYYPNFNAEFGRLEGDTLKGLGHHKSAIITLVECVSKKIITLNQREEKTSTLKLRYLRGCLPYHVIFSNQ